VGRGGALAQAVIEAKLSPCGSASSRRKRHKRDDHGDRGFAQHEHCRGCKPVLRLVGPIPDLSSFWPGKKASLVEGYKTGWRGGDSVEGEPGPRSQHRGVRILGGGRRAIRRCGGGQGLAGGEKNPSKGERSGSGGMPQAPASGVSAFDVMVPAGWGNRRKLPEAIREELPRRPARARWGRCGHEWKSENGGVKRGQFGKGGPANLRKRSALVQLFPLPTRGSC